MRPYIELVEIGLKLHNLEEIKELLNHVLEDVDLVKKKGELWIEEKETSTFMEMKQFITEKTSEILNRCTSVSSDQTKELDVPALKVEKGNKEDASSKTVTKISTLASKDTYLQLTEKVKEIDSNFSLQSKKLKKLQQKLKDQQTITKRQEDTIEKLFKDCEKENNSNMSETQTTFNERVQEIRAEFMTELQAASSFISQQQTQWETFCLELKEKQEINKEHKELDVSTKFEELFEEQKELSKKLENILEIQKSQEMKQIHGQQTLEMKKVKTESLDQATGLSDFKCIEDSQLHIVKQPNDAYGQKAAQQPAAPQQSAAPQQQPMQQQQPAQTSYAQPTIDPQTGEPDYSQEWIEYYRSLGMIHEAQMVLQQVAANQAATQGGRPGQ